MSAPPITVGVTTPVREAQRTMEERRIQHLPVIDGDRLIGIVSDIHLQASLPPAWMRRGPRETSGVGSDAIVANVMVPAPVAVDPDERAAEAARLMLARRVSALPVVDQGRLVGIITATDLLGGWARS